MGPRIKSLQGKWRPGMPQEVSVVITILFTLETLVRGLDYITGDREGITLSLTVVETAFPLQVWGALLILSSLSIFVGIILRRPWWIIYGSFATSSIYLGLTWGLFLKMLERGWPWDGYRTPVMFLVVVAFWSLIGWGTHVMTLARAVSEEVSDGGPSESDS